MRLVIIESPYAGDVVRNTAYARAAMLDCLRRGEAPLASHLLYTQVLDDTDPAERTLGICAGHEWVPKADAVVLYVDLGISPGMDRARVLAQDLGIPVERRFMVAWGGVS